MTFDRILAADARKQAASRSVEFQQHVENLLEQWETACVLSRGPDVHRAAHWEAIAKGLHNRLFGIAGMKREPQLAGGRRENPNQ